MRSPLFAEFGELAPTLSLGNAERSPNARAYPLALPTVVRDFPSAGLKNARRYSIVVEVQAMLTISCDRSAAGVMTVVIIAATLFALDLLNNHALGPISAAPRT